MSIPMFIPMGIKKIDLGLAYLVKKHAGMVDYSEMTAIYLNCFLGSGAVAKSGSFSARRSLIQLFRPSNGLLEKLPGSFISHFINWICHGGLYCLKA